LVDSGDDGVEFGFNILLMLFVFFSMSFGVAFDPGEGITAELFELSSFFFREFILDLVIPKTV